MSKSMFDFIGHVNQLMESVDAYNDWERELDNVRTNRAKSMAEYAMAVSGDFRELEVAAATKNTTLVENAFLKSGINALPIDSSRYPKRQGMSGPFRYRTGAVLYFDPNREAYYDSNAKHHISISEAIERMGVNSISEDENRSDAEIAIFFESRDVAMAAYRGAIQAGLVEGEVTYDATVDPKYGLGRYAIRLAPHVRITKPETLYSFLEAIYDFIEEQDVDQFEWLMNAVSNLTEAKAAATDKGTKKAKDQLPYDPMPRHNVYHERRGRFSSPSGLKASKQRDKGSSSFYWDDEKQKAAGVKRGGLQFKGTAKPCGRAGRLEGTYLRCRDGKKSYGGLPKGFPKERE